MRRVRFFVLIARLVLVAPTGLALGCAATAAEPERPASAQVEPTSGSEAEASPPSDAVDVAVLREEHDARGRRIEELESRLALSTREARDLRAELDAARERHGSVRIGDPAASREGDEDLGRATSLDAEPQAEDDGSGRVVLRLYGAPPPPSVAALPGPVAPPIVPPPPPGALDRLPVVITPGAPDSVPAIPLTPVVVASAAPAPIAAEPSDPHDPIVLEYRAALAHVSQREWADALGALGRFVSAHPDHPYADNAMYWRGEVLYAQRDYAGAITELSAMIERFPHGNKVPDALLRIGFSYQRLGERERAREIFRRVREQFPGTVAARTASREDA